jgi:hypothetical protein
MPVGGFGLLKGAGLMRSCGELKYFGGGGHRKVFFFEKKKQKAFASLDIDLSG